ncbi:comF family protein [Pseudidiomarina indica]|uniref:ComF family protein n=1 Tax=Pseudidiomarina indica TaxID=1159017 RepID=A0A1G6CPD7_9GAMM|nr:phosphoribosyltransferase family protein [Pseudidiomarina indica]SDB34727.1 comF family protein [Pseudidiomarina indica]
MLGYCWLCDQSLRLGESTGLCRICLADLPRLPPSCLRWRCARPELANGRYWFAGFSWQPDIQHLIHRFKFQRCPELAAILAPLLAAQIQHCYRFQQLDWPDVIVAMPMTYQRWCKRGYNQAGLLTHQVARLLQRPVAQGLLRRIRDEEGAQHQADVGQRWKNMTHSMHCTRSMTGLTVAVVDDVLTTGASMSAAADALLRRGAKAVDAWAFAYVEPHQPQGEP